MHHSDAIINNLKTSEFALTAVERLANSLKMKQNILFTFGKGNNIAFNEYI